MSLRLQALLRAEQRGRAIGAAERDVDVVQHGQPHAAEQRARRRQVEVERAEQRLAGGPRHARAQPGEQAEAAVDGRRAAERDEHVRRAACERGAQQVGEPAGAGAAAGRARAA